MPDELVLHFDGACEPNPGRGAWGWVLDVPGRGRFSDLGVCAGRVTNNVAEWTALGKGVRYVFDHAAEFAGGRLVVCGDSKLVIDQATGRNQCHKPQLARLRDRVLELCSGLDAAGFPPVVFAWVRREENAAADALSVRAWEAAEGRPLPLRARRGKPAKQPTPTLFDTAAG